LVQLVHHEEQILRNPQKKMPSHLEALDLLIVLGQFGHVEPWTTQKPGSGDPKTAGFSEDLT